MQDAEEKACKFLKEHKLRFPSCGKLINKKFYSRRDDWINSGNKFIREITESINELYIAKMILEDQRWNCTTLAYEPDLPSTEKSIDFLILQGDFRKTYLDVKTIHPTIKDDWEKFQAIKNGGRLPENMHVHLSKKGLGGEIWHKWYNSRERMLKYTLEIEDKIQYVEKDNDTGFAVVFCGNGSDWGKDELEDFADFYLRGFHNPDDCFRDMESHEIKSKNIKFLRNIDWLCCFHRKPREVESYEFFFDVRGPWIVKNGRFSFN